MMHNLTYIKMKLNRITNHDRPNYNMGMVIRGECMLLLT